MSLSKKKRNEPEHGNFCEIGFAKISLAAQKILVAQNLGGGGRVGSPQLPRPVRSWAL